MNPGQPCRLTDHDAVPDTIGRRIAHLRVLRGLTQYDLAAAVGVQRPTVGRWEAGMRMPYAASLIRIAAALDVDPRDLWVSRRSG